MQNCSSEEVLPSGTVSGPGQSIGFINARSSPSVALSKLGLLDSFWYFFFFFRGDSERSPGKKRNKSVVPFWILNSCNTCPITLLLQLLLLPSSGTSALSSHQTDEHEEAP